jgi:hypothetical protein
MKGVMTHFEMLCHAGGSLEVSAYVMRVDKLVQEYYSRPKNLSTQISFFVELSEFLTMS